MIVRTTTTRRPQAGQVAWLVALASAAGVMLPLLFGCGSTSSELTGPDAVDRKRDGALAVFVNRKVTDDLNVPGGDSVDWKYVDIPKPGQMTVAVAFDTPERINGQVVLRDNFATLIERQELTSDRSVYEFETVEAVRGRYYIELEATGGSSVYTLGVAFNEPTFGEFATTDTGFNRVDDEKDPRRWRPRTGGPKPTPTTNAPPPVDNPPVVEETPEDGPPPTDNSLVVGGTIQRVIPMDDDAGGSLLTIALSGNEYEQVRSGTRGTVTGLGANIVVRRRNGRVCNAYTKAEAEDVKPYKRVVLKVR